MTVAQKGGVKTVERKGKGIVILVWAKQMAARTAETCLSARSLLPEAGRRWTRATSPLKFRVEKTF